MDHEDRAFSIHRRKTPGIKDKEARGEEEGFVLK